jgi:hypothetical protein
VASAPTPSAFQRLAVVACASRDVIATSGKAQQAVTAMAR